MSQFIYEVNNFGKIYGYARIEMDILAKSPILIKGVEDELSDRNLMRFLRLKKASGEISCVIPGSSVKGFVRGTLDRMQGAIKNITEKTKERFGYVKERSRRRPNNGSTIFFDDFEAIDPEFDLRPMIGIDPATMTVARGAMVTLECIREGTFFKGGMSLRNWDFEIFGLLKTVMDMANMSLVSIGSNKSRGFGNIEFKNPRIILQIIGGTNDAIKLDNQIIKIGTQSISIPNTKVDDVSNPLMTSITLERDAAEKFFDECKKYIQK